MHIQATEKQEEEISFCAWQKKIEHVDVASGNKCLHVWMGREEKGYVDGQARGLKMGQLTLSMGPARAELFLIQRATIPSNKIK
jgi:hypothetical protein